MSIAQKLLCFLVISFAGSASFAQQPPKEAKEKEPELIADYHFIFDRYGVSTTLKSRNQSLDGLAQMMRSTTDLYVYIVSSGGRVSYVGEATERANVLKKYLVGVGGVNANRIEIVDDGHCMEWEITLWWGVKVPPSLRPTSSCYLDPKKVKIIEKRRYNRRKSRAVKPRI
jgi:hypothetical protein